MAKYREVKIYDNKNNIYLELYGKRAETSDLILYKEKDKYIVFKNRYGPNNITLSTEELAKLLLL